jgi:hypothetical protein
MLNFLNALFGGALLVAGRKLFWLFVGVIGFIIGIAVQASTLSAERRTEHKHA